MKKTIIVFLSFMVLISTLSGCGSVKNANGIEIDKQSQQYINKALSIVNDEWKTAYSKRSDKMKNDKTVEIINTRVINIKENNTEEFGEVVAVVEFDILSDYYGSSPCYFNVQQNDTVAFYKDGSTKTIDLFNTYGNKYYNWDFSGIIENVIECGGAYNTNKIKTEKASKEESDIILAAIETLQTGWAEDFTKHNNEAGLNCDGTLKIINTRLVTVDPNSTHQIFERYFGDVQSIVEFEIYSDYLGSSPYYVNVGINDTVIVHTDGTFELTSHYIRNIISATFNSDFSQIFSEVKNFGDKYNETFNVLEHGIKSLDEDYFEAVNDTN